MYQLKLKSIAELEATEAAKWYNKKRIGLGEEFLLALDAKLHTIKRNPEQFQIIYKNIHRALTERFPFGIFYIIENKTIFVIAILHTSRNPNTWLKRK
jgi:toxin ParE1/3/4